MSKRDTLLLIEDMLQSSLKIKKYTAGLNFESFSEDEKTIDAVVRNFEVIGEAANRIDENYRISNPQIEWVRIRGFRNRIVHEYFGIDLSIVWEIIQSYLEKLILDLNEIIVKIQR
jgi:uncharacterized protein with HEPN domain